MKTPANLPNSALSEVTPLILTYNEAPNILRTLDRLSWADRVVVIDSFSSDRTIELLGRYPNVEVFYRKFDGFAQQCNYGLAQIDTEWVLSIDADYVLSHAFVEEMSSLLVRGSLDGVYAKFKYCIAGKPLNHDNTTPRKVLYRRLNARYENVGHQHRVNAGGREGFFHHPIYHDDRKSLSRWLRSQDNYLTIEARKLHASRYGDLDLADKIRKTGVLAPLIIFFYCLVVKRLLLKGWHGWYYTLQRTLVEALLAIKLISLARLDLSDHTTFPDEF